MSHQLPKDKEPWRFLITWEDEDLGLLIGHVLEAALRVVPRKAIPDGKRLVLELAVAVGEALRLARVSKDQAEAEAELARIIDTLVTALKGTEAPGPRTSPTSQPQVISSKYDRIPLLDSNKGYKEKLVPEVLKWNRLLPRSRNDKEGS